MCAWFSVMADPPCTHLRDEPHFFVVVITSKKSHTLFVVITRRAKMRYENFSVDDLRRLITQKEDLYCLRLKTNPEDEQRGLDEEIRELDKALSVAYERENGR